MGRRCCQSLAKGTEGKEVKALPGAEQVSSERLVNVLPLGFTPQS